MNASTQPFALVVEDEELLRLCAAGFGFEVIETGAQLKLFESASLAAPRVKFLAWSCRTSRLGSSFGEHDER
jgi:hypothetical protein